VTTQLSTGELIHYASGVMEGLPYKLSVFPAAVIGGYGNPKSTTVRLSVEYPLKNTLLNISVSGKNLAVKKLLWKVSLGTVTLVREFKPQVLIKSNDISYASIVFDVAQILKEPGKYELSVSCESSESVRIDEVGLIGIIPLKGASVYLNYWAGEATIAPGESYEIELSNENEGKAGLVMVFTTPSRSASMATYVNKDKMAVISGIVGTDEVSLKEVQIPKKALISVKHLKTSISYYPKNIVLHEIVSYIPLSPGPRIELDVRPSGEDVEVYLKNAGSSIAYNVVVVGISGGFMVFRKVVESIMPGEEKSLLFRVAKKILSPFIVRAVYYGVWGQTIVSKRLK